MRDDGERRGEERRRGEDTKRKRSQDKTDYNPSSTIFFFSFFKNDIPEDEGKSRNTSSIYIYLQTERRTRRSKAQQDFLTLQVTFP